MISTTVSDTSTDLTNFILQPPILGTRCFKACCPPDHMGLAPSLPPQPKRICRCRNVMFHHHAMCNIGRALRRRVYNAARGDCVSGVAICMKRSETPVIMSRFESHAEWVRWAARIVALAGSRWPSAGLTL